MGKIHITKQPEENHVCDPPRIYELGDYAGLNPKYGVGSLWQCEVDGLLNLNNKTTKVFLLCV